MLTIGEFSRLGRVSPRMLRYYDALGLLCPEQVGENGYRYYQQAQLETLLRIRRFQDYGFPLAQVGELLDSSGSFFCSGSTAAGWMPIMRYTGCRSACGSWRQTSSAWREQLWQKSTR